MKKEEAFRVNPVTLAFIGDAVYTLYVREKLVRSCEAKPSAYQASAAKILSAVAQSAAIEKMISAFTEDEAEVYRRGRNAKKATKSKHASVGEYNRSTGLEAVIGYLYLSGEKERINELLSLLAEEDFSVKTPVEPYKGQR
ncbi:MAG: Mini-ribonuclease 3 [Clostridia bacterium]|nr:Mini-ribonuclease 3 [Clostridia bacterium]